MTKSGFAYFIVFMIAAYQVSTAKESTLKTSDGQNGKHLDSFLVFKAYNSLIEAGKALEELIRNHGTVCTGLGLVTVIQKCKFFSDKMGKEEQKRGEDQTDWEFMRFGRK